MHEEELWHAASAFFAFLVLAFSSFLIYRQKTKSPNIKLVRSSLLVFVLLLSFTILIEAAHHIFEAAGIESYEFLTSRVLMSLSFIMVVFLTNAISASLTFPRAGSQMELFKLEFSKLRVVSFLNIWALAMAFITFLPGVIIGERIASPWYYSVIITFVISSAIVLSFYFWKHMVTTGRRRGLSFLWGGTISLIVLQFFHYHTEKMGFWLAHNLYWVIAVLAALVSTPFISTAFRENEALEQFFLRRVAPSVTVGEGDLRDVFSKTLGLSHQQLGGRKILLEFDPTSNYEKAIQDFVTEALANAEPIAMFTRRSSAIHSGLSKRKGVRLLYLTQQVSVPTVVASENELLLPINNASLLLETLNKAMDANPHGGISIVFDSLSELLLSNGFEKTYSFMRYALDMLPSSRVTALFLFNPSAHDPEVASGLRSLFNSQVTYGEKGLQIVKLPKFNSKTRPIV